MVFIIITLVVALITGIVTTFMNELVLGGLYDINSGLAMRAIYIFLKLTHESDEAPQYKKRLKNTVNQLHPDIATKLIVLIYQQYGFIKVYKFLLPFFDNS